MVQELQLQYSIIAFTMSILFIICGHQISEKSRNANISNFEYWKYASFIIIGYVIFMGLRYGRLVDYNVYSNIYDNIQYGYKEGFEPLFAALMLCFKTVGLKYASFIAFTSFLFIFSFLLYIRDKTEILKIAPLIFLPECFMAENLIKWYVAFSTVLIALYFYNKRKYLWAILFAVIASKFHFGMILVEIPLSALLFVKRILINNEICLILFIVASFIGSVSLLNILAPIMPYLGVNEKLLSYTEQFNDIISGQFGVLGIAKERGNFEIIRSIISFGVPIILAPKLVKQGKLSTFEVNAFYIGVIIEPIFSKVEIASRISGCFHFFQIIVCSYVYMSVLKNKIVLSPTFKLISIVGFICLMWLTVRYCLAFGRNSAEDLRFIWDVNSNLL